MTRLYRALRRLHDRIWGCPICLRRDRHLMFCGRRPR